MPFVITSFIFFIITFGPRFFDLMNFKYRYFSLGLYSQVLSQVRDLHFNPEFSFLGLRFFDLKPTLIFVFLLPLGYFSFTPALLLFFDEASVLVIAATCARFCLKKTQSEILSFCVFIFFLFWNSTLVALHEPANLGLWGAALFSLLLFEFLGKRRVFWLGLWGGFLIVVDLRFWWILLVLAILNLVTQRNRWNLRRRLDCSFALLFFSLIGLFVLRGLSQKLSLNLELGQNAQIFNGILVLFMGAEIGSSVSRFWPAKLLLSTALISGAIYSNLISSDPLFQFWKVKRWSVSPENQEVHALLARSFNSGVVASSETLSPFLASNPDLLIWGYRPRRDLGEPVFVFIQNEQSPFDQDPHYQEIERLSKSGTRLLKKIK